MTGMTVTSLFLYFLFLFMVIVFLVGLDNKSIVIYIATSMRSISEDVGLKEYSLNSRTPQHYGRCRQRKHFSYSTSHSELS